MPTSFNSPLTLYVLWHPEYSDGALLAHKLFNVFSRNVDDPFARTPGIPVYFRSSPLAQDAPVPRPIPFEEAEHTAIVVLVDDHMVVGDEWSAYVAGLEQAAAASAGMVRLFPVAINANAFNFPVANTNFIRLFEVQEKPPTPPGANAGSLSREGDKRSGNDGGVTINIFINSEPADSMRVEKAVVETASPGVAAEESAPQTANSREHLPSPAVASDVTLLERQATFLIGKLVHELSRLLYHQPRVTAQGVDQSAPPVRMFISHAKADGADIAAAIRNQIHSDTSLKSFFDANDIAVGYRFSAELLAALEESAVICLQTDYYATREWCLWEVINAKRYEETAGQRIQFSSGHGSRIAAAPDEVVHGEV